MKSFLLELKIPSSTHRPRQPQQLSRISCLTQEVIYKELHHYYSHYRVGSTCRHKRTKRRRIYFLTLIVLIFESNVNNNKWLSILYPFISLCLISQLLCWSKTIVSHHHQKYATSKCFVSLIHLIYWTTPHSSSNIQYAHYWLKLCQIIYSNKIVY